jgi:excisionase family DNA binding protein
MEIKNQIISSLRGCGYDPSRNAAKLLDEMGNIIEEVAVFEKTLHECTFGVATFKETYWIIGTRNTVEDLPEIIYQRFSIYNDEFKDHFKEANDFFREYVDEVDEGRYDASFVIFNDDGEKILEAPDSHKGSYRIISQDGKLNIEYADKLENLNETKEWMSVDEVAAYIRVKSNTIYKYVEGRKIPFNKIPPGQGLLFKKETINEWLDSGKVETIKKYLR